MSFHVIALRPGEIAGRVIDTLDTLESAQRTVATLARTMDPRIEPLALAIVCADTKCGRTRPRTGWSAPRRGIPDLSDFAAPIDACPERGGNGV